MIRIIIITFILHFALSVASCSDATGPNETIEIQVSGGLSPLFSWNGGNFNKLLVFQNDTLRWGVTSQGSDGIYSSVRYGTVPPGTVLLVDTVNYIVNSEEYGYQLSEGTLCKVEINTLSSGISCTQEFFPRRQALSLGPGLNDISFRFKGAMRELYIVLPGDYNDSQEYPIVFFFHGLGGSREWGRQVLGNLIQDNDFIGVSAQGIQNSWNAGSGGVPSTEDDVGFVIEIIQKLLTTTNIDESRIYTMGYSNGGALSYRLARDTDKFAAISSMSASHFEGLTIPPGASRTSVLHIHGEDDAMVPYNGGQSNSLPIVFESAMTTVTQWAAFNGLSIEPEIDRSEEKIIIYRFESENNPYDVVLYTLEETTHHMITHEFISSERCWEVLLEFFLEHIKN